MKKFYALAYQASHIGTSSTQEDYINRKTVICNQIAWIQLIVSTIGTLDAYVHIFPLFLYVLVPIMSLSVLTICLNYMKLHRLARTILIFGSNLVNIFHEGMFVPVGGQFYTVLHLNVFIVMSYPFFLFGRKEKYYMIIVLIFSTVSYIAYPMYVDFIPKLLTEEELQYNIDKQYVAYIIILFVFYAILYINMSDTDKATERLSVLNEKATSQNTYLKEAQQSLKETLQSLKEKQKTEFQQNKISRWLTKINNIINYTQYDASGMYHQLILEIVSVLEINQVGLYSVNRENPKNIRIELVSSYAYGEQKVANQSIKEGEGLLGQAYVNKEKLILKDIPKGYTRISSGLGSADPKYLAIIPLSSHHQIEGLIEIASFRNLEDFEIEFLERAGQSLATFMATEREQSHTQKLLEKAEQQTQVLHHKELEMQEQIEKQQKTAKELRLKQLESEDLLERFNLVTESTHEGLWEAKSKDGSGLKLDPDHPIYWSKKYREIIGYTEEELPNTVGAWFSLLHPDYLEQSVKDIQEHLDDLSGRTPYEAEYQIKHKDGYYIWIKTVGRALRNEVGVPIRMAGSLINIQPLKDMQAYQEKLAQQEAKYRHLFEYSSDPVAIIDHQYKYVDCNQAALDLFCIPTKQEFFDTDLGDFSPEYQPNGRLSSEMVAQLVATTHKEGKVYFDWVFRKRNGKLFRAKASFYLYQEGNKTVIQANIKDAVSL